MTDRQGCGTVLEFETETQSQEGAHGGATDLVSNPLVVIIVLVTAIQSLAAIKSGF